MRSWTRAACAALLSIAAAAAAQTVRPGSEPVIKPVELPEALKLPAVGNVDAAQNWRFGRIERALEQAGQSDLLLEIRTYNGMVRVTGPAGAIAEFARASRWSKFGDRRLSPSDYVERMVAFDADSGGRLIAMISLEPMNRDEDRLVRAIRG